MISTKNTKHKKKRKPPNTPRPGTSEQGRTFLYITREPISLFYLLAQASLATIPALIWSHALCERDTASFILQQKPV